MSLSLAEVIMIMRQSVLNANAFVVSYDDGRLAVQQSLYCRIGIDGPAKEVISRPWKRVMSNRVLNGLPRARLN